MRVNKEACTARMRASTFTSKQIGKPSDALCQGRKFPQSNQLFGKVSTSPRWQHGPKLGPLHPILCCATTIKHVDNNRKGRGVPTTTRTPLQRPDLLLQPGNCVPEQVRCWLLGCCGCRLAGLWLLHVHQILCPVLRLRWPWHFSSRSTGVVHSSYVSRAVEVNDNHYWLGRT